MAFKGRNIETTQFNDLLTILANTRLQQTNNPLYQVLSEIIKRSNQNNNVTVKQVQEVVGSISSIGDTIINIRGNADFIANLALILNQVVPVDPATSPYVFPNAVQLLAGTSVSFDTSIPNQLTINVTGGAVDTATYLTEADETGDLPNSRQLLAGTNVSFDDTTPGERTVNVTTSSGVVVQIVNTESSAQSNGTTQIPMDDTIPQNTEGFEVLTVSITPTDAANRLKIEVVIFASVTNQAWINIALFQDSVANALAASGSWNDTNTAGMTQPLVHNMVAGTTSTITFKVRIGPHTAETVTFNGQSSARRFGGVAASSITVTEYTP